MREPEFWQRRGTWQASLLKPFALAYGAVAAARMQRLGARVPVPVLCVGNFHMGGAGKTQVALTLARLLQRMNRTPAFLSRGYGGNLHGPVRVDPAIHTARDVGDEPLLLARAGPTIIARERAKGAALAIANGANAIVMDDGFQNPSLHKDVSLIVVDAARGLGNGEVFPAGPLRAPLDVQLSRTDALIVIGEGTAADVLIAQAGKRGIVLFRANIVPDTDAAARLRGQRVLAFTGIGDPMRFFETLRQIGADVVATKTFADHHMFSVEELQALVTRAGRDGLALVTTEKDMARIVSDTHLRPFAAQISALPVNLAFADETAFAAFIATRLKD